MNNVFLSGEKIDLCVPQEDDFEQWASWFNDQTITQFLEQGMHPNSQAQQRIFYEQSIATGRFISLIKTKDGDLLGVISLSEINMQKRSCQVAYVCPVKSQKVRFAALEALAICTQHAFVRIGVETVWAGHAYPGLKNWIKKTEIIGYRTWGVSPRGFRHGIVSSDAAQTSILKPKFTQLMERRGGNLWPGEDKVRKMLFELKKHESLAEKVERTIKTLHAEHEAFIDEIEVNVD